MRTTTPVRILLADDDEDDCLIFRDAIQEVKQPTTLQIVSNGVELMKTLCQNTSAVLPDLVFLDLNMPKKNGIECLQEIRTTPHLRDLTVAIYSTSGMKEDIEQTFILGANVYIRKPNEFAELVRVLSEVINLHWQYQISNLNRDNFVLSI